MSGPLFNPDDMSHCPIADTCEVCGGLAWLTLATFDAGGLGTFCGTVCEPCAEAGRFPPLSVPAAVARVCEHCIHRGVDLDGNAVEAEEGTTGGQERAGDGPAGSAWCVGPQELREAVASGDPVRVLGGFLAVVGGVR